LVNSRKIKMKNINMQKQQGFTLIELVIVIVILGILAATAAPKFIDLQGDAKGSTIQGVKAAIETATAGVHAKSLIAGNDTDLKAAASTVTVAGATVEIGSGWPLATTANFTDLLDVDATAFDTAAGTTNIVISPAKATPLSAAAAITASCYAQYVESTNTNTKPAITAVITGC